MKLSQLKAQIDSCLLRDGADLEVVVSEGPRKPALTVKATITGIVEYHDGHLPGTVTQGRVFILLP